MRSGNIRHSEQQLCGNVMRSGLPRVKSCTRVCFHVEGNQKSCLFPVHVYSLAASVTFKQKQTNANDIVTLCSCNDCEVLCTTFTFRYTKRSGYCRRTESNLSVFGRWHSGTGSGTTDQTERCPVFDSSRTV